MAEPAPPYGAPDPDAAISVRDVVRDYRRPRTSLRRPAPAVHALRGVSFDVAPGEHFGIVGESGCGKSTLLRIIAGLDRATSGTVMVDGHDITALPDRRLGFLRAPVLGDDADLRTSSWSSRTRWAPSTRG